MWLTHVDFRPSYLYKLMIIIVILSTLLMLLATRLPLAIRLGLMLIVFLYGAVIYSKHGCMRSSSAIYSMSRINPREWQLNNRDGGSWVGYLRGDSLMTSWLMVLRFKVRNRWFPVSQVVFRDAVGQHDFRRLLVTLKLDH